MGYPLEQLIADLLEASQPQETVEDNLRIVELVRNDLRDYHLNYLRNLEQIRDRKEIENA